MPIIKFVETTSNLAFDISFDVANGPQAAESVRQLMHELPPMKPLVLVLKIFLQQREFNEVGHLHLPPSHQSPCVPAWLCAEQHHCTGRAPRQMKPSVASQHQQDIRTSPAAPFALPCQLALHHVSAASQADTSRTSGLGTSLGGIRKSMGAAPFICSTAIPLQFRLLSC